MSFRAGFWLVISFLLLADIVLLLLSPVVGAFFLALLVLAVALMILLKPERWEQAKFHFRKKQKGQKQEKNTKNPQKMVLKRCDSGATGAIVIDHSPFEIGRSADCDYMVEDMPSVGRHHCRIIYRESTNNYYIEDLGSKNGTFVNSFRLAANTPMLLKSGSMISLDRIQFIFIADRRTDKSAL